MEKLLEGKDIEEILKKLNFFEKKEFVDSKTAEKFIAEIDDSLKKALEQYVDSTHPKNQNTNIEQLHKKIKERMSYALKYWNWMTNKKCILSALNEFLFYVAAVETPLKVLKKDEFDLQDKNKFVQLEGKEE